MTAASMPLAGEAEESSLLPWPRLALLLGLAAGPVVLTSAAMIALGSSGATTALRAWMRPMYVSHLAYAMTNWLVIACATWLGGARLRECGLQFGWTRIRWRSAVVGFGIGVAIYLVVDSILEWTGLPRVAGMEFRSPNVAEVAVLVIGPVLTAPLSEEVLFRVIWVGALSRRIRLSIAVVLSIGAFAAIHYPYFGVGGVIFISAWSLVPTVLFLRTGNMMTPVAMHVLNNILAYLVAPFVIPRA